MLLGKIQETYLGEDMNGTPQVLPNMGDDKRTIERTADVLLNIY